MIDKTSNEYQQGFIDGVNFSCKHLGDIMKTFVKNIQDLVDMQFKE